MYPVSNDFINKVKDSETKFNIMMELTTKEGDKHIIDPNSIFDFRYTAESTFLKFSFGLCSACDINLVIGNFEREWDNVNLASAVIDVRVGISESEEIVPLGKFTVDEKIKDGDVLNISAYDDMFRFNKKWKSNKDFKAPCTITELIKYMCEIAKPKNPIKYSDKNPQFDFVVDSFVRFKPKTLRDILGLCADAVGCFAIINRDGELELKPIKADINPVDTIEDWFEFKQMEEVTITGVRLYTDIKGIDSPVIVYGDGFKEDDGHLINLMKYNSLFKKKTEESIRTALGEVANRVSGLKFLPCEIIPTYGNPALEVGDIIAVTDEEDNTYNIFVSSLVFDGHCYMEIDCYGDGSDLSDEEMTTVSDWISEKQEELPPDTEGYSGGTLKTDGENTYWDIAESSTNILKPPYVIDVTQSERSFVINGDSQAIDISIINTNKLDNNAVENIIIIITTGSDDVKINWDSFVKMTSDECKYVRANKLNEFILRLYKLSYGNTWLLSKQEFNIPKEVE